MPFNNGLTLGFMPACSVCGHEYRQAARFCEACGAALAARPAAASEQRKRVTVLFSDVTGSTALGERLDPESLRAVMARYFELARRVVERRARRRRPRRTGRPAGTRGRRQSRLA